MDFSDRQQYQYHYEQSHQETLAIYDPSQSHYNPYYAYHRQQQEQYYDYSSTRSYPPINPATNTNSSSQIGLSGMNQAAEAATMSQLSEFAGTMDAADRAAMANGGPPPSVTLPHHHHHHHYTQHYPIEHGHVAIGPVDNGGRWGKRPFRGGGGRGRGQFRGRGGGGSFSHYPPKGDGEALAPVRGRGGRGRTGKGGGRKPHQSAPDSQPTQTTPVVDESSAPGGGKEQTMTSAPAAPVLPRPPLLPVAWCDTCRVECTSLQIMEQHKNGKRHKRTEQKLEEIHRQQKIFAELQAKAMPDTMPASASIEKLATTENIASAAVLSDQAGSATKTSTTVGNNPVVVVSAAQLDVASSTYNPESNPNVVSTAQQDSEAAAGNAQTAEGQLEPAIFGGAGEAPPLASLVTEEPTEGSSKLPSSDGGIQSDRRHGGVKRRIRKFGRGGKRLKSSEPARDRAPERAKERHRICTVCNIVCESLVVFESHLAGKKHASRIKQRHAEGTVYGPLTGYIPPNPPSAYPTRGQEPLFYGLKGQETPLGPNGLIAEQHLKAEGGDSEPHAMEGLQHP